VLTMDLHAPQLQGFFDIPVDHLYGFPVLSNYLVENNYKSKELVVVAPDVGSVKRSRNIATRLDAPLAIIDKRRPGNNMVEVCNIIGDVKDKNCLMVDDMIDTAGTLCKGAEALHGAGAKKIYACCTHAVFSGQAVERLEKSQIDEVIILNTYDQNAKKLPVKIKTLSAAPLFAEAIERIYADLPLSKLYE